MPCPMQILPPAYHITSHDNQRGGRAIISSSLEIVTSPRMKHDTNEEMRAGILMNLVTISHGRDAEGVDGEICRLAGVTWLWS